MKSLSDLKNIKRGQWLLTCSMQPEQFSHWRCRNPKDYGDPSTFNPPESYERVMNYDDFETIKGSGHSEKHCSLTPISESYAKYFIDNKFWELYDPSEYETAFVTYERKVRERCELDNVVFEGI